MKKMTTNKTKKTNKLKHDTFTDILHKLLLAHAYHRDVSLGKLLTMVLGVNDLSDMSDEDLLDALELFYHEK